MAPKPVTVSLPLVTPKVIVSAPVPPQGEPVSSPSLEVIVSVKSVLVSATLFATSLTLMVNDWTNAKPVGSSARMANATPGSVSKSSYMPSRSFTTPSASSDGVSFDRPIKSGASLPVMSVTLTVKLDVNIAKVMLAETELEQAVAIGICSEAIDKIAGIDVNMSILTLAYVSHVTTSATLKPAARAHSRFKRIATGRFCVLTPRDQPGNRRQARQGQAVPYRSLQGFPDR